MYLKYRPSHFCNKWNGLVSPEGAIHLHPRARRITLVNNLIMSVQVACCGVADDNEEHLPPRLTPPMKV